MSRRSRRPLSAPRRRCRGQEHRRAPGTMPNGHGRPGDLGERSGVAVTRGGGCRRTPYPSLGADSRGNSSVSDPCRTGRYVVAACSCSCNGRQPSHRCVVAAVPGCSRRRVRRRAWRYVRQKENALQGACTARAPMAPVTASALASPTASRTRRSGARPTRASRHGAPAGKEGGTASPAGAPGARLPGAPERVAAGQGLTQPKRATHLAVMAGAEFPLTP